jgi:hypothetical protein
MRTACDTNNIDDYYNLLIQAFEELPPAETDMSVYSEKLWQNAYERGRHDAYEDLFAT